MRSRKNVFRHLGAVREHLFVAALVASGCVPGCHSDDQWRNLEKAAAQKEPTAAAPMQSSQPDGSARAGTTPLTGDAVVADASEAMQSGDPRAAAGILRQWLIQQPDDHRAIFLLARALAADGDQEAAIETLASISLEHPEYGIAAMGQRAEYLSEQGRLQQSIPLWRQILDRHPTLHMARSKLAIDLYRQGNRTDAAEQLRTLVKAEAASPDELRRLINVTNPPPSRIEKQLRDTSDSETILDPSSVEAAGRPVSQRINQAWTAIQQRRYRAALQWIPSVDAKRLPAEVRCLRVWLRSELGQLDIARREWSELDAESERYPSYWLTVGNLAADEGQREATLTAYVQAFRLDPTFEPTLDHLASALAVAGHDAAAESIDERRFAIAGPTEAVLAIGPGQPDDAIAGQDIVRDLVELGHPQQAAAWLAEIGPRHPGRFGDAKTLRKQIAKLREAPDFFDGAPAPIREAVTEDRLENIARLKSRWRTEPVASTSGETTVPDPTFGEPPMAELAAVRFRESAVSWNVKFQYEGSRPPKQKHLRLFEQLGSGVAAIDYDRDGRADLMIGQSATDPRATGDRSDRLFRNLGDSFSDVTEAAGTIDFGYTLGVTFGDWNQDGMWDLAIGRFGTNRLWINQGDGTFVDRSEQLANQTFDMTASLAIADVTGDRLPDLIQVNYVDDESVFADVTIGPSGRPISFPGPNKYRSALDVLHVRRIDGTTVRHPIAGSTNSVDESGKSASNDVPKFDDDAQPGLGLFVDDLNGDQRLEILVANDTRPNQVWRISDGDVSEALAFNNVAGLIGLATSSTGKTTASMGIGSGDIDLDGRVDLVVTNWFDEWTNFYRQVAAGFYRDQSGAFGLDQFSDHHVGFGIQTLDLENDGRLDVVVANGHVDDFAFRGEPQRMPTQVLRFDGGQFTEADGEQLDTALDDETAPRTQNYFSTPHGGRCLITADFDRDGRVDFAVTDLLDPFALLLNQTATDNAFIQIEPVATATERSAVGTRVQCRVGDRTFVGSMTTGDGYMGKNEHVLHFGLGDWSAPAVDITCVWPDGSVETFRDLGVNERHVVVQGHSSRTSSTQ